MASLNRTDPLTPADMSHLSTLLPQIMLCTIKFAVFFNFFYVNMFVSLDVIFDLEELTGMLNRF